MQRGFFGSLFDISFTSFVTTKIIKFVYVVSMVLIAVSAVVVVVAAFNQSAAAGVLTLFVGAPIVALLYLIYVRILLEFIIQVFRAVELLNEQNQLQRAAFSRAGWLGAELPVTPPRCPECGTPATPDAVFCGNCGHRFE
jgi:hypothetical protein